MVSNSLIPNTPSGENTNLFFTPSETTTGDYAFMINKVLCYPITLDSGVNTATAAFRLISASANFITNGVKFGDIVVNSSTFKTSSVVSVVSEIELVLNNDIFLTIATDTYAVYSEASVAEAERVSVGKITLLNSSSHTTPDSTYPAYIILGDSIKVYPSYMNRYGMVNATYFRYPLAPKWTYVELVSGEPIFDQSQSDYQDFELAIEDEYKLVMKILQYCGISIRETEVAQYAIGQEQNQKLSFGIQG